MRCVRRGSKAGQQDCSAQTSSVDQGLLPSEMLISVNTQVLQCYFFYLGGGKLLTLQKQFECNSNTVDDM